MRLDAFIDGTIAGLATLSFIGPVLFTLLNASLQGGWRLGFLVATGIFVSDIVCILCCMYGAMPLIEKIDNQILLSRIGGVILLALGLKYFVKPSQNSAEVTTISRKSMVTALAQGFVINFVNPFVFFVWIGYISYAKVKYPLENGLSIFLIAALMAIYSTDILKALTANKIKAFLKPHMLRNISRFVGLVLIAGAIRLFWVTL